MFCWWRTIREAPEHQKVAQLIQSTVVPGWQDHLQTNWLLFELSFGIVSQTGAELSQPNRHIQVPYGQAIA